MNRLIACLATTLAASAAWAGPYSQAWAEVESGSASEVRKEARLAVTKLDGKSNRDPRRSGAVEPGKHVVTVRFETARGVFHPNTLDLEMDLEPCVRYRVVASYTAKTGPDWKPVIYSEPIGECRSKYLKASNPK